MTKLVFWTALNSYRSEKWLRGKPEGTPHPVTTKAWTKKRLAIWQKFTLASILGQAVSGWLYVVLLDPELRHLTEPLLPRADARVIYAYDDGPALERLKGFDEVVLALIDGDDMYSHAAGQMMLACPAPWMYFRRGYAYEVLARKVWRYDTIGTGPFFAHRLDPKTMTCFDRDKRHPTHKAVAGLHPVELPEGQFCVLLHDANTSSNPTMRYVLRERPVRSSILKEFGR